MNPTRLEIQEKINEIKEKEKPSNIEDIQSFLRAWLEKSGCPLADIEKIVSDIASYE